MLKNSATGRVKKNTILYELISWIKSAKQLCSFNIQDTLWLTKIILIVTNLLTSSETKKSTLFFPSCCFVLVQKQNGAIRIFNNMFLIIYKIVTNHLIGYLLLQLSEPNVF